MPSVNEICNAALLRCGDTRTIDSIDAASAQARACKVHYEQVRDRLLVHHPWQFATTVAFLALIGEVDETLRKARWAASYALPDNCLWPWEIWAGVRDPRPDQRIEFKTEYDAALERKILLTDLVSTSDDEVELLYTVKLTNPLMFDPLFVDALEWELAAELATALKASDATERKCRTWAQMALSKAMARESSTGFTVEPESEILSSRD